MSKTKDRKIDRRKTAIALCGVVIALGIVAVMIWPSPAVELDQDSYAITIALYRTCNLRDEGSLTRIEAMLDAPSNSGTSINSEAEVELRSIIALAKSGDWNDAMQSCHQLIDQQAVR